MVKAILYDKDGTLMQFDAFWIPVATHALREIFFRAVPQPEIAEKLTAETAASAGVEGNRVKPNSVLCAGTYGQLAEILTGVLARAGYTVKVTQDEVECAMQAAIPYGKVLPGCENLRKKLLAAREFAPLFVVTTDTREMTLYCLDALGIADLFDGIFCDDGVTPHKPDPAAAVAIASRTGATAAEIYMVGDTGTDGSFARRAGIHFVSVGESDVVRAAAEYAARDVGGATDYILSCVKKAGGGPSRPEES